MSGSISGQKNKPYLACIIADHQPSCMAIDTWCALHPALEGGRLARAVGEQDREVEVPGARPSPTNREPRPMMKGYKVTSKVIESWKSFTSASPSEVIRPRARGKTDRHTYITKCTHP
jgi:hypothetical protein